MNLLVILYSQYLMIFVSCAQTTRMNAISTEEVFERMVCQKIGEESDKLSFY